MSDIQNIIIKAKQSDGILTPSETLRIANTLDSVISFLDNSQESLLRGLIYTTIRSNNDAQYDILDSLRHECDLYTD